LLLFFTPQLRAELEFAQNEFEHRRGDGPQVELDDTAQVLQTVHRELELCADLIGEVVGEVTQQVHNISCTVGMRLLKASSDQSKYEIENRQRREKEVIEKTKIMLVVEEERKKIELEFTNDVIRLEHMYRVMADTDADYL